MLLAQMACTFSLSAPPSPHLYASHLQVDISMAQNWPKSDPKSPAYTLSNPKVAAKCTQSGSKFTPQLHKIINICGKNKYFAETHQNDSKDFPHVHKVTSKWPPSASKVATSSPHNCIKSLKSIRKISIFRKHTKTFPKNPSCTQSNPQVIPKCSQRVQGAAKLTEKPLRPAGPQARLASSGPS